MPREKNAVVAKRKKLTKRQRNLASKYIGEEMKEKKYPRKQAIAIGISRARQATKKKKRSR